ncbi:MAG: type II toxin-antitoxin system VapC family toxin [Chloroflexi bacterium]|nr:type II toxin-antitoxin system VapC family toxin [Chloroflexota bacterium]
MPDSYVLDSFAVISLLRQQPGGERVRELLRQAAAGGATLRLSAINVGEVVYIEQRSKGTAGVQAFLAELRRAPVIVEDASWERILAAAHVKGQYPVSYADAFAIALAEEHGATLVTGDPEFRVVAGRVTIEWLR